VRWKVTRYSLPRKRSSSVVAELVGAVKSTRVGDEEQVVLVVLDLGQRAGRGAVLDRERVELEDALEDGLVSSSVGSARSTQTMRPLSAVDEPQGLELEILADELALAEDEGMDHAFAAMLRGRATVASPACRWNRRSAPVVLWRAGSS
jgi:hypothetical protein